MKPSYRHTQRVNLLLATLPVFALLVAIVSAIVLGEYHWMLWTCFLLLALGFWMFSSLTVQVDSSTLKWHYGPGIFRWRCPLAEIEAASSEPDPGHWVWRWGIRIEPYGYLYSISGGETVRIRLQSGKQFGIRTDESEELLSAIRNSIAEKGSTLDT